MNSSNSGILNKDKTILGEKHAMDKLILWALLFLGIALLLFSFIRKPLLIKNSLLAFLIQAYFSTFFGVIVVETHTLDYPVRFLPEYFDTSILFEYVLFPVVCVYFYQTSLRSSFLGIVGQSLLYTAAMTVIEVLCEKHTDLIEYYTWKWWYSFVTMFLLTMFVRSIMLWVDHNKLSRE